MAAAVHGLDLDGQYQIWLRRNAASPDDAARQRLAAMDIPVLGAVFAGGSSSLGGLDIQYPAR